ncbi:MAG: hypothetical protein KAJ46_07330 [Sedimentisphaerales bacterium]|nr:hypothetical protein [Sedimentisphaerales bacterium]
MNDMNDVNNNIQNEQSGEAPNWNTAGSETFSQNEAMEPYASTDSHNHTAMILLGVCILSMLGVYLFGLRQKPQEASEEEKAVEAQVDTALANLVSADRKAQAEKLFRDTENMVKAFYDYPSKQQVAADDLNKNPFYCFGTEADNKDDDKNKTRAQLEKELRRKVALLELQSVLQSTSGAKCLINGEIFATGQKVIDTFNIRSISPDSVVLTAGEHEFVLQM